MKEFRIHRQNGIAVILLVVFLGIIMTVATFGAMRLVNSTQQQSMSVHSVSQAQGKAWQGVSVIFRYLETLAADGEMADFIDHLEAQFDPDNGAASAVDVSLGGVSGLQAQIVDFENIDDSIKRITANISASSAPDTRAASTSTVQVIFQVEIGDDSDASASEGDGAPAVITFNRDLRLGGDININRQTDAAYVINVHGSVDATSGNSISGVDTINATDSIDIGSGSSFNRLNSNGDIRLTGSVTGDGHLNARGNICLIGGTSADGAVKANGFVYGEGSASFGDIQAIGESTYEGANRVCDQYQLLDSQGDPFAVNMAGNNSVRSVMAKASVRFNSGSVTTIPGLRAEGDLRDTNWGGRQVGTIGGGIENAGNNPQVPADITIVDGYTVDISPVGEIVIDVPEFNAYDHEAEANYVFRVDANGYKKVTVQNVAGIDDGEYYLADYQNTQETGWSRGYKDFLCPENKLAADSSPQNPRCAAPVADPPGTICYGYSTYNHCFSYNAGTETWSIGGTGMSQGIAWFEGNLTVGNGTYYNTFIATGNISTAGGHQNYAPNYAGYSGTADDTAFAPGGICTNGISPYVPAQLCDLENGTYNPDGAGGVGNYAYMAGSVQDGAYVGGNVDLGSSTNARGSVLAGNEFHSGGNTTVHGFITAWGGGEATYNSMGNTTNIEVEYIPPTYTPMEGSTLETGGNGGNCEGEDCAPEVSVEVLWSRYL